MRRIIMLKILAVCVLLLTVLPLSVFAQTPQTKQNSLEKRMKELETEQVIIEARQYLFNLETKTGDPTLNYGLFRSCLKEGGIGVEALEVTNEHVRNSVVQSYLYSPIAFIYILDEDNENPRQYETYVNMDLMAAERLMQEDGLPQWRINNVLRPARLQMIYVLRERLHDGRTTYRAESSQIIAEIYDEEGIPRGVTGCVMRAGVSIAQLARKALLLVR